MANSDNAPFKSYQLAGYVISNSEGNWRAVDPASGDVKFAGTRQSDVDNWAEKNKLTKRKK